MQKQWTPEKSRLSQDLLHHFIHFTLCTQGTNTVWCKTYFYKFVKKQQIEWQRATQCGNWLFFFYYSHNFIIKNKQTNKKSFVNWNLSKKVIHDKVIFSEDYAWIRKFGVQLRSLYLLNKNIFLWHSFSITNCIHMTSYLQSASLVHTKTENLFSFVCQQKVWVRRVFTAAF